MAMTRRDYVAVADILARHRPEAPEVIDSVAHDIGHLMSRDNPRFDIERFTNTVKG